MKKVKDFLPLAKPVTGKEEEQAVVEAIRSGWITLGPKTAEFEKLFADYIGCKHAIAVNSGTAALHLALLDLKLQPGDEVIIPAFTFAATANTVIHSGGIPVLADIESTTFCLDPNSVEEKINDKTRAIVPVHYAGHPADMRALEALAKEHSLAIIEDAATAVGTEYRGKKIGDTSEVACFSFHPIKNMTTGDGGMITTNDEQKANRMRLNRLQGMDKESWKRLDKSGSWSYQIVSAGLKYNMTDISSAMGIEQLKKLPNFQQKRAELVSLYQESLSDQGLTFQKNWPWVVHSHNLFPVLLPEKFITKRDTIIDQLKEKNIGANVYYIPLNFHPFYQEEYGWAQGDAPVTESIFRRLLNLPLYPSLKKDEVNYIVAQLKELLV